jgi:hypothetical protein
LRESVEKTQIARLCEHLKEMDELLEKILHTQMGINDKRWLDAILTIEEGFSKAVNFIAEIKGKKVPVIATKEDIDRILSEP